MAAWTRKNKSRLPDDRAVELDPERWESGGQKCNLVGTHPEVQTAEDAMNRLIGLGIWDGDVIDIGEWDDTGKRLNA